MRFVKGGVSRAIRTLRAAASPSRTASCRSRRRWWLRFAAASPPRRRVRVDRGSPVDVGTPRRRGSQRRAPLVSRRPRSSATASTPQSCAAAGRAPWEPRRPPLDRRNSPARPRPIHAVSAAPSAIDKLCSAGGRSGPRPAPVLAAIHPGRPVPAAGCSGRRTSERRGRTRSRGDPSAAGARRRASPASTWGRLGDHRRCPNPAELTAPGSVWSPNAR